MLAKFASAQQNVYDLKWKRLSTENGLSNRVVNTVCQDESGYIWIGTNDGLNKLNGDRVIQFFNTKDYLQSNNISNLCKISNNKIFVATNSGCVLLNCNTNKFEKIIDTSNNLINEFYPSCIEINNKLWIFGNKGIYTVIKNSVVQFQKYHLKKEFLITKGGSIKRYFEVVYTKGYAYANMGRVLLQLDTATMQPVDGFVIGKKNHEGIKELVVKDSNIWIATWGNGVIKFNLVTKQQQYFGVNNDIVFSIQNIKHSNIFFAATQTGISIIDEVNNSIKNIIINSEVGRVFIDNKLSIWLTTANGVFYSDASANLINQYRLSEIVNGNNGKKIDDKRLASCFSETNNYYFLGIEYANGLAVLDKNFKPVKYISSLNNKSKSTAFKDIKYVLQDGNNYWVTCNAGLVLCNNNLEAVEYYLPPANDYISGLPTQLRKLVAINNNELLVQATTGILIFNKRLKIFTNVFAALKNGSYKHLLPFCTDFCMDNKNNIYVSTEDGVAQISLSTKQVTNINIKTLNKRFNAIVYNNNNLYLANDGGFVCYNLLTRKHNIFTRENGLSSSLINTLTIDKNGNGIWVATANGLNYFNFSTQNFSVLNSLDGLPDNNIEGCLFINQKGEIVIGNIDKITRINTALLTIKNENKAIKINSISVNDSFINYTKNNAIAIPGEKNEIVFDLGMPALYLNSDAKYFYNINHKWYSAENNVVRLSNLQNGQHEIYFSNTPYFSKSTQSILLNVEAPLYKKSWFVFLCFIAIAFAFYFFFKFRLKKIKSQLQQKNQIEKQIQLLKETAFRAQMNPHFMFNTLNAINAFIVENKTDLASDYLIMFSKLMRNILENSKHPAISLEKELASLKLYLELESARLEQGFDYEIIVDKTIAKADTVLPPLILQPFVENAIWHGLRNKKNDGKVWINITAEQSNLLCIEICDNGIGISVANKSKQHQTSHKSYGIEITKERIELLNPSNTVIIKDRVINSTISGTVVTIKLHV